MRGPNPLWPNNLERQNKAVVESILAAALPARAPARAPPADVPRDVPRDVAALPADVPRDVAALLGALGGSHHPTKRKGGGPAPGGT